MVHHSQENGWFMIVSSHKKKQEGSQCDIQCDNDIILENSDNRRQFIPNYNNDKRHKI